MQGNSRTKEWLTQAFSLCFLLKVLTCREPCQYIKEIKAMRVKLKNRQLKSFKAHKHKRHVYCEIPHAKSTVERRGLLTPLVVCKGMKTHR